MLTLTLLAISSLALTSVHARDFMQLRARQDTISTCLSAAGVAFSTPSSADYDEARHVYNSQFDYRPAVVTHPAPPLAVEQIQASLKCASASNLAVVSRSGGHSYFAGGAGGKDGSMVISLRALNNTTVDPATQIARVEPGEVLGGMYAILFAQGQRAVAAGTCPSVGVGGHAAHGGVGFSTREHGLLLDAIVQLDYVLANGTAGSADANTQPELFYALRGAASSLAVVYAYHFATFQAPTENIAYGYGMEADPAIAVQVVQAIQAWAQSDAADPRIGFNCELFLGAAPAGKIKIQTVGVAHMPAADFNASIAKLVETLPVGMREPNHRYGLNWTESLLVNTGGLPLASTLQPPRANYASSFVSGSLGEATLTELMTYLANEGTLYSGTDGKPFAFLQMHLLANSAYSAVDEHATAVPRRSAMWNAQAFTTMTPESGLPLPADAIAMMDGVFTRVIANEPEDADIGQYLNYATTTTDNIHLRYYGDQYKRLAALKSVIDPDNRFSFPLAVGQ